MAVNQGLKTFAESTPEFTNQGIDNLINLVNIGFVGKTRSIAQKIDASTVLIVGQKNALKDLKMEVELGFDKITALEEAERCLNCDIQTVFSEDLCIECDACVDICPTDCISFVHNDTEENLRNKLRIPAVNLNQQILVSEELEQTSRVMVKDEDVCLHCGLCAERCPTGAWDMQNFLYQEAKAYS